MVTVWVLGSGLVGVSEVVAKCFNFKPCKARWMPYSMIAASADQPLKKSRRVRLGL